MDNLVFEESVNAEVEQSEFISKKWVYVNDSNSQNYTSQVVIDSTPLANSGGWINWAEGYIAMPLVVELKADATNAVVMGANDVDADHAWAFKAGFWHMINSMTLEFNNQNVVQQTPFTNVFRSFKTHTSWSEDDLKNEGSTTGYYPDNAGSWTFQPNSSAADGKSSNGVGLANNKAVPVTFATCPIVQGAVIGGGPATTNLTTASPFYVATSAAGNITAGIAQGVSNPSGLYGGPYCCNEGFNKRSEWYGYDTAVADALGQSLINSTGSSTSVLRPSKLNSTSNAWSIIAKLRLKDLSDFFLKCPLLKGSTIRFYINTNQTSIHFTKVEATFTPATGALATNATLQCDTVNVIGGLTNPLMVASAGIGQGSSPLPAGGYTLSVGIFRSLQTAAITAGLQSCRLYAPVYKMNPLAEQRYLQLAPTKKIDYDDTFQYQFNDVKSGQPFNILVSNGISDIQSVLVVPFITAAANNTTVASATNAVLSTLLSPFSTSGATPDPIIISNFNILVSGMNLFLNNQLYDFEQFNQELKSSNQLNGSLTTGLASGLISEDMFERGYRYYYGNCSRILPSEAGVSRSVQIQGKNESLVDCNLMVFVSFKRSITIDISTGARIE
jgi:hypothetical protein